MSNHILENITKPTDIKCYVCGKKLVEIHKSINYTNWFGICPKCAFGNEPKKSDGSFKGGRGYWD